MRKIWFLPAAAFVLLLTVYMPVYAAGGGMGTEDTGIQGAETEGIGMESVWGQYGLEDIAGSLEDMLPDYQWDMQGMMDCILRGNIGEAVGLLWDGAKGKLAAEVSGLKHIFAAILVLDRKSVV